MNDWEFRAAYQVRIWRKRNADEKNCSSRGLLCLLLSNLSLHIYVPHDRENTRRNHSMMSCSGDMGSPNGDVTLSAVGQTGHKNWDDLSMKKKGHHRVE